MTEREQHIIVFGNEKGGTGKSTLAMHLAIHLLREGHTVGVVDLDTRQRSVSRFLDNRAAACNLDGLGLPLPMVEALTASTSGNTVQQRDAADQATLEQALDRLRSRCRFVVIDCPGSHTHLSRLAHALADTLVTPINDSFVDMDVIGEVDPQTWQVRRLSHYAEMVWDSRKLRSASELDPMDWVVTTNRVGMLSSRNNRRVERALKALKERIMFRHVPGLSERVIYRELFPRGLTMMDLADVPGLGLKELSHVAAREEVRQLARVLNLPT